MRLWLQKLSSRSGGRGPSHRTIRPVLETFEDRCLPSITIFPETVNFSQGMAPSGPTEIMRFFDNDDPDGDINNFDFTGNRIVRNPKWSGNATLNAVFPVPGGNLEASVDSYYNSGYYFDAQNASEQKEYALLNSQLSYFWSSKDLRITLFGDNLTGEKYYIFKFPVDFGVVSKLQAPVTYGVRLSWNFE